MKQKTIFLCSDCGYESPKWYGKCPSCGAWNTLSEYKVKPETATRGVLPEAARERTHTKPRLLDEIDSAA